MNPVTTHRLIHRLATATAAAALLLVPASLVASAGATAPQGSNAEVILETKDVTGQPWNASLHGWWGHEGKADDSGSRPTFLSLDMSDGHGVVDNATMKAVHKALHDGGDFSSLRVAFVPYSADGHNERPHVTAGETAGQAFTWFADLGVGSGLNGTTNPNDFVSWVSTQTEYSKWWNAGRPVQGFSNKLGVLDVNTGAASANPQGKSILNRWPAGTKLSLVFYVSDGFDKAMPQEPTVKVGPDGRALTAWLTFKTVASPDHPVRTSGGYKVLTGAGTGPGVAAKPKAGPDTANPNPDSPSNGATPAPGTNPSGTPSGGAPTDRSSSGFTSSLPGGQPTFYVLLVLVVAAVVGGVTVAMRRRN